MATKWPGKAQTTFQQALEEERTYKVAIVGSPSLGKDTGGWSVLLSEALVDAYGEDNLEVSIFEYSLDSRQFLEGNHDEEVAGFKPDLVLLEPFRLKDNTASVRCLKRITAIY